MIITNRNNLEKWLEQNDWFEDGYISNIVSNQSDLIITLGIQISGTFVAGDPMTLREYNIKPHGIIEWTFKDEEFSPGYDSCIEGIELPESGFGLIFRTPNTIELLCESIEIDESKIINTITKAWTSKDTIFVEAKGIEIPKPKYWIDSLKEKGIQAGFRYYCGDFIEIIDVPYPDYSGFFIQLTDKINETQKGIFFNSITNENKTIRLAIELADNDLIKVWNELQKIISSWPNIIIHSGNVSFNKNEWIEFLESRRLPRNLERTNKTCGNTG